ncbi:EAL domain-containing protein [Rhodoferax saidenbachensis]|uniref:Diguanylate cyclase (GGDEF)-like protein/PAS domain S-box-containing protein n=1 Tax=Rhodoferax saidenbachensis TaxID=1484693 RepID=A0ABU1ZIY6_9BURK|nr:EAL domain-containing protein [Rhodoferax saidenbachensis]MDR7305511.1 diguanylate cyclase (GGDEF)-like protein/PAS domain S-box-containing protein [Rhodoferax saidenbachensis]
MQNITGMRVDDASLAWVLLGKGLDLYQDSVFITGGDGRFIYVNDAATRALGYGREALLTMGPPDIDPSVSLQRCLEILQSPQGHTFLVDTVHRTQGGDLIPVQVHGVTLQMDGQSFAVAIARDMSESKRMQETLLQRQQYWRTLLDEFPFFVWLKDEQSRLLAANTAYARVARVSSTAELEGRTEFEFFPHDLAETYVADDKAVMAAGVAHYVEELYVDEHDQRRWMEVWKSPLHEQGKVVGTVGYSRDITDRKHTESELQKALAFTQGVIDAFPDLLFETDRDGRYLNIWTHNPELLAASRESLLGRTLKEVLSPESVEIAEIAYVEAERSGVSLGHVISVMTPVGLRQFELSMSQMRVADGARPHFIAVSRDVTRRLELQQELTSREREYRTLVENSPDVIARFDLQFGCRYANPVLLQALGRSSTGAVGCSPLALWGGEAGAALEQRFAEVVDRRESVEFELHWSDALERSVCSLVSLTPEVGGDASVSSILMVARDISELKAYQDKIHQMAFYDPLTGMPNRVLFNDRLAQMLKDAAYHRHQAGVMVVDLDRFKQINDTMGHATGDALLKEVAVRLRNSVRSYDTVARLGGDEFGILLPQIRAGAHLTRVAGKVLAAFKQSFWLEGREIFISCSVGIAVYPTDSMVSEELLKYADSAMYSAKRSGRNDFRFYSKDLTVRAQERLTLESDLRHALERGELALHYQPKVLLGSGAMVGCEALLRWAHPRLGMVPPDQFIPVAEDSGLINELGAWVLRESCLTAVVWNAAAALPRKVAVNLSVRQIQVPGLVAQVQGILAETHCQPQWLEFEITESLLLDEDGLVVNALQALRDMGVTIAIDDFGTGYSALSYLARFPIDTLKIDRSFIHSATTDHFRAELVRAILSIARCLNQQVVAEGVETRVQADFLAAEGCQLAQGYLFSKAVPREQLLAMSDACLALGDMPSEPIAT